MIIGCPSCRRRFRVSAEELGAGGRHVRCSACREVWFQVPEEKELDVSNLNPDMDDDIFAEPDGFDALTAMNFDTAENATQEEQEGSIDALFDENEDDKNETNDHTEDFDDENIPDAIKPIDDVLGQVLSSFDAEETDSPEEDNTKNNEKNLLGNNLPPYFSQIGSYSAAGTAFFVSFILFLSLHGPLTSMWYGAQGAYRLFGVTMDVPGQGLVFDHIRVVENSGVVRVEGDILNLSKEQQVVPLIEAALLSNDGDILQHWYIEPPKLSLDGEEPLSFESEFEAVGERVEDAKDLRVRFVLRAQKDLKNTETKIDEVDVGNSHAPVKDETNHQSAHEES